MNNNILGIGENKLDNLMKENVVVITNNVRELNIFAEHGVACIYTSNVLNTAKEIENLKLNEKTCNEFKVKEIYLCFTEEDPDTFNYYRKFREESFIAEKLTSLGLEAKSIQIDAYKKELQIPSVFNETNKELLKEYLDQLKESYKQKVSKAEASFIKHRKAKFRQEQYKKLSADKISTGYKQLDKMFNGGLEEGLYMITGGSSVGKTAFATNLADNIALQGHYVLYFSLEMKESNLIARGISRIMYLNNKNTKVSYKDIETGRVLTDASIINDYELAEDNYFNIIGEFLTIEEGNLLSTSHEDIYQKAKTIRDITTKSPIIIVDYLQQMTSATNPDALKSVIIEQNVAGLKQISKDLETPVIAISSLSRTDALEPISQQSFAHTSAIEYTADVCMGLALEIIYSEKFKATKSIAEKRLLVNEAIAEKKRMVRLSIVKNRLGVASNDILMDYIPRSNTYQECPEYMQKEHTKQFEEVKNVSIPEEFTNSNNDDDDDDLTLLK